MFHLTRLFGAIFSREADIKSPTFPTVLTGQIIQLLFVQKPKTGFQYCFVKQIKVSCLELDSGSGSESVPWWRG